MSKKYLFALLSSLVMIASQLNAQSFVECCPDPEYNPNGPSCGVCGIAYEEAISLPLLVTTVLVGIAAVTVVAIALANTPNSHAHSDDSHHHHHHHHHHNCH